MRDRWNHPQPPDTQPCPPDNTSGHVGAQVAEWMRSGTLIHPESAMEIAAWWHGPGNPGLTAFSHTGTVTCDLRPEIAAERKPFVANPCGESARRIAELDALAVYLDHVPHDCPGLQCAHAWHEDGCTPFWRYFSADGSDISGDLYAEDDAVEKVLWAGPDGPDGIWHRNAAGQWVAE